MFARQDHIMLPLSVLDLAPIGEGSSARQALSNSRDLAQHAERWGYQRFWLAEHHNMPGIASAATAVVMGHVAAGTSHIRVGSGGIMLPNHAPLVIAEQFGTLAELFPKRIDMGLGRAPGTDAATSRALRRRLANNVDEFPQDVAELMSYFEDNPNAPVRAFPGAGCDVEVWILGSSLYGAQLAGVLGLPYAFASHFAPAALMDALQTYREHFRPSRRLAKPHVMLGVNVVAADTDEEAQTLFTSIQQAVVALRRGKRGRLPKPHRNFAASLNQQEQFMLDEFLGCSFVGRKDTVMEGLHRFAEKTGAHELMVAAQIHDHSARLHSYELIAQQS